MRLRLGLVMTLTLWVGTSYAESDPYPKCTDGAQKMCMCELEKLRPTQVSVGWLHVEDISKQEPSKLRDRAKAKPTKVVIGPDKAFYVTDGHHHALAMLEQLRHGDGPASTICSIDEDDSGVVVQDRLAFLKWLAGRNQARLNGGDDVDGEMREGLYPPDSLEKMTDDSYRSLASIVERGCDLHIKGDYGQFPLADLLRHAHVKAPTVSLHDKEQGRHAAVELLAKLDTERLQAEFNLLPYSGDIRACPTGHP